MVLNTQQQLAFDLIIQDRHNVFVTGPGGVGKSYLIETVTDALTLEGRRYVTTAPTGVAALNVGGCTIQSLFKLPIYIKRLAHVRDEEYGTLKWMIPTPVKELIRKLDVLIIDEISMLSSDMLEIVDFLCKKVCGDDRAFGNIQVVFIGDFYQLPPVPDEDDKTRSHQIREPTPKYSFFSNVWKMCDLKTVYLNESFRQLDTRFFGMLSDLRVGDITPGTIAALRSSNIPSLNTEEVEGATVLFSSNNEKDAYNGYMLEKLGTAERRFRAQLSCPSSERDFFKKHFERVPNELCLRLGAKAIISKNMYLKDHDIKLVNGDTCRIVGWTASSTSVLVRLDRFVDAGDIEMEYATWEAYDPAYPGMGVVVAKIMQLPLILGWAVTIHKSQGLTLSSVCISFDTIFLPGQAYVALSRARTLEGVSIYNFNPFRIKACPAVSSFYKSCKPHSAVKMPVADRPESEPQHSNLRYRMHSDSATDASKFDLSDVVDSLVSTIHMAAAELPGNKIQLFINNAAGQLRRAEQALQIHRNPSGLKATTVHGESSILKPHAVRARDEGRVSPETCLSKTSPLRSVGPSCHPSTLTDCKSRAPERIAQCNVPPQRALTAPTAERERALSLWEAPRTWSNAEKPHKDDLSRESAPTPLSVIKTTRTKFSSKNRIFITGNLQIGTR